MLGAAVPLPIVDHTLVQQGVPGLALEGDQLRLTLFPAAGAKILDLVHTPSGVDLLWKNPRVPLAATYPGPAFDDVWCGGWDELFPTDPPCAVGGNHYSDHGDLWHGPWEWEVVHDDGHEATVYLRRFAVALPCLMEKWITLRRDGLEIGFRHRLTNLGTRPEPYTWSLHVAHAVGPGSRILLPATRLGLADAEQSRFGAGVREVAWPVHEGEDLQQVLGARARPDRVAVHARRPGGLVHRPARQRRGARAVVRPVGLHHDVDVGRVRRLARALRPPDRALDEPAGRPRGERRRRHRSGDRAGRGARDLRPCPCGRSAPAT